MKFTKTKVLAAAGLTAASVAAIAIAGFGAASAAPNPPCNAPQGKKCLAIQNFRDVDVFVQVSVDKPLADEQPAAPDSTCSPDDTCGPLYPLPRTILYCQKVPAKQQVFLTDDAHQLTTGSHYRFGEYTHSATCSGFDDHRHEDTVNPSTKYYWLALKD